MKQDIEARIIQYFEGELSEQESLQLEQERKADVKVQKLFESYSGMYTLIDETEEEIPRPQVRHRFNDWLHQQQELQFHEKPIDIQIIRKRWSTAAAVALVLIGTCLGVLIAKNSQQQSQIVALVQEMSNTRKMLALSMLEQNSASQRIKAMYDIQSEVKTIDPEIISALSQRLLSDENINVRIAAVEAIAEIGKEEAISHLLQALNQEQDQRVQISIIEALVEVNANQAIPDLEDLLLEDSIEPVVKESAAKGIEILM